MNKRPLIGGFVLIFCAGLFAGYLIPYAIPRTSIYDKLQNAKIVFSSAAWKTDYLRRPTHIQQIKDFEQFRNITDDKHIFSLSNRGYGVYVWIDSDWNVVWIELWNFNDMNADYLGFYFYSEPD